MSKEQKSKKISESSKKRANQYVKYSGMAIQMAITIGIGTFIGKKLDAHYQLEKPYLTILCALVAVVAAMYLVLKDLIRQ